MAVLRVPQRFRRVLAQLPSQSEAFIADLTGALRRERPTIVDESVVDRITARITSGVSINTHLLVEAITSLYVAKCAANKTAAEIARDVAEGLASTSDAQGLEPPAQVATLDENLREKFSALLEGLLSIDSFDISARATGMVSEFPAPFSHARIFSDFRPVFETSSLSKPVSAGLVIHNLRITYLSDGEPKEIYLTLDKLDLDALAEAIVRAQDKDKALRSQLSQSGITVVAVGPTN